MSNIKVTICDDHPLIVEGIKNFISKIKDIDIVCTSSTKEQLILLLKNNEIDIVLLDIQLTKDSGVDICKEIKAKFPKTKVIGLSNIDESHIILKMIQNGASGYLIKHASLSEIEKAIRCVYTGEAYYCNEAQLALFQYSQNVGSIPPTTSREKEILALLAQGLNSAEIATQLFISSQTVDSHRKNLMNKFKVNKTINLIAEAKKFGIIH